MKLKLGKTKILSCLNSCHWRFEQSKHQTFNCQCIKIKDPKVSPRFDKTKYVKAAFCQTLSDIPWCKIYQCSSANDMFNMFVYLLSSALEKHAPFKKVFLRRKLRNFSKKLGLTRNAKTYYVNGSWPLKDIPRNHLEIGLLIVNYDQNYRPL